MPTFNVELILPVMVNGSFFDRGLSVQVSSSFPNPFNEPDKINNAFKRIHGIELKNNGYLNVSYLEILKDK